MRNTPHHLITVIAFVVLALIAAACGGSGSSASDVASGDSPAEASETDPSSGSSSEEEPIESPIGDLLGEVFGVPVSDSGAMDEYFAELGRQAEVNIAECMLAEGFEYSVVDYGDLGGAVVDAGDDREFAENYGFGITSNPFEESFEAFEQFEDPNEDYVRSLTPGEQDAYYATLYGSDTLSSESETTGEADAFQPAGCQDEAFEEVFSFAEVFDEFNDEFQAIDEAYEADPRVVAASASWSECMSAAGYRYTDVEGARDDINRRYRAIIDNPDAALDPEVAGVVGSVEAGGGGDAGAAVVFGSFELKPEYQAQVDALAVEERALATASWDCEGPLREVERTVLVEYEQKFVDENGAAIRSAMDE